MKKKKKKKKPNDHEICENMLYLLSTDGRAKFVLSSERKTPRHFHVYDIY